MGYRGSGTVHYNAAGIIVITLLSARYLRLGFITAGSIVWAAFPQTVPSILSLFLTYYLLLVFLVRKYINGGWGGVIQNTVF